MGVGVGRPVKAAAVGSGKKPALIGMGAEGVVFDARLGGTNLRLSVVRKKAGEYELGLRDRVLRARTELR